MYRFIPYTAYKRFQSQVVSMPTVQPACFRPDSLFLEHLCPLTQLNQKNQRNAKRTSTMIAVLRQHNVEMRVYL